MLCSLAVLSLCSLAALTLSLESHFRSASQHGHTFICAHTAFTLTLLALTLYSLSLCSLSLCSLSLCFQDILFNSRSFSRWVLNAFWHSAVLSLLPTFITSQLVQEEGVVLEGTWVLGDSVFTCVVFVINAKLMLEVCCSIRVAQVA